MDPNNARRVLVAWQEAIRRIWTARTEDGGRTWQVEVLHDPATLLVASGQEGFDPTAAIGPDGTMYVLMGVTTVPGSGLTLVRLDEGGWSFHRVDPIGEVHLWDAMHFAVAPDSGALYAVAQSVGHRGIGFWQSSDRGDSWSIVRFPHLESAESAPRLVQDGFEYWPRIAAGPDGLVLLVNKAFVSDGEQIRATVSLDSGETFGPITLLTEAEMRGRLVGVPAVFDGSTAVAAYVTDSDINVLRANQGTGPWDMVRFPRENTGYVTDWSTAAAHKGTLWVLHTEQGEGPAWRALLTKIRRGFVTTTTLADLPTGRPRGNSAGDEYGGLAIARDGCVWAAWSEPEGGLPVIAVTKRC